jgi:hypothetical protein
MAQPLQLLPITSLQLLCVFDGVDARFVGCKEKSLEAAGAWGVSTQVVSGLEYCALGASACRVVYEDQCLCFSASLRLLDAAKKLVADAQRSPKPSRSQLMFSLLRPLQPRGAPTGSGPLLHARRRVCRRQGRCAEPSQGGATAAGR